MYACICHAVTAAEVEAQIADGARSVKAVRRATGAGASCGSCVKRLSCLLAAAAPAEEAVAEPRWKPHLPRLPKHQHQPDCPAALPAVG